MPNEIWHNEYPTDENTPPRNYSAAVGWGDLVFISGQASVDAKGTIIPGTFEEEFRRSVENLRLALQGAGCDLKDVVQVRSYVRDAANVPLYNQLYREYFKAPLPARTTLTNCLPETLHFELECVAIRPR